MHIDGAKRETFEKTGGKQLTVSNDDRTLRPEGHDALDG